MVIVELSLKSLSLGKSSSSQVHCKGLSYSWNLIYLSDASLEPKHPVPPSRLLSELFPLWFRDRWWLWLLLFPSASLKPSCLMARVVLSLGNKKGRYWGPQGSWGGGLCRRNERGMGWRHVDRTVGRMVVGIWVIRMRDRVKLTVINRWAASRCLAGEFFSVNAFVKWAWIRDPADYARRPFVCRRVACWGWERRKDLLLLGASNSMRAGIQAILLTALCSLRHWWHIVGAL